MGLDMTFYKNSGKVTRDSDNEYGRIRELDDEVLYLRKVYPIHDYILYDLCQDKEEIAFNEFLLNKEEIKKIVEKSKELDDDEDLKELFLKLLEHDELIYEWVG